MDGEHLRNTINLLITKIKDAQFIIRNWIATSIDMIWVGINQETIVKKMTWIIENNLDALPQYIYESAVRWMDFSIELQQIHGRSSKTDMQHMYNPSSLLLEEYDDTISF